MFHIRALSTESLTPLILRAARKDHDRPLDFHNWISVLHHPRDTLSSLALTKIQHCIETISLYLEHPSSTHLSSKDGFHVPHKQDRRYHILIGVFIISWKDKAQPASCTRRSASGPVTV
jgi:hypothetical protein